VTSVAYGPHKIFENPAHVFDEAYFHAFSYLTAPAVAGERSMRYPNLET
jgi:hypothetical protein